MKKRNTNNDGRKKTSIGLDLSLTASGVVVVDISSHSVLSQNVITSKPSDGTTVGEIVRLNKIVDEVIGTIVLFSPEIVVIEGLAFMAKNTTALVQLSALNYFVRRELVSRGIPFLIVAPPTLKKFLTGHGNAQKDQIMLETYKRYGESFLDNNLCDAYGLARCGVLLVGGDTDAPGWQKDAVSPLLKQLAT